MDQPPVDPQDWTDEQWLAWLDETDHEAAEQGDIDAAEARRTMGDRVRSSPAARGMGGAMIALHEIFYKPKEDEVVIVASAAGEPPDPDALELDLDPDHPEASTARIPASRRKGEEGDGR
ncbi:MAG TPA: hypothetical protein VNA57_06845 [Acidimicrobiales bacterium]|nr:hypothetical protein [Acidimicrobiales bacterium]